MKILVLNCGSSSIKFQLVEMPKEEVLIKGYYERVGTDEAFVTFKYRGEKDKYEIPVLNHEEGIKVILEKLLDSKYDVLKDISEIVAVGHRLVHGGEKFAKSVLIDDEVIAQVEKLIQLAPLHNPSCLAGVNAMSKILPDVPMVAVFDTSFHQTMPPVSYIYNIPYEYYEKYSIRKYGFHGTSHRYVGNRIAELLGKNKENINVISCHLGQGASICAIQEGKSIDTSMGLTPLAGIPMGSRSGNIDPSIIPYICKLEDKTVFEVDDILNKKSGLLGISGISADCRDVEEAAAEGHERSILALESNAYLTAQTIGAYAVSLGKVDVITFTAGIGEKGAEMRQMICDHLGILGIKLDPVLNDVKSEERKISTEDSKIEVWIVPTDEEIMIARDTVEIAGLK